MDQIPAGAIPIEQFQPAQQETSSVPAGAIPIDQFQAADQPEGAIPIDQFEAESDQPSKYGSLGQQAITGLEGAAQGIAGPIAPFVETHMMGVKPEDIAGREKENPITHGVSEAAGLIGGALTGTGEAGLIGKGLEAAIQTEKMAGRAKVGGMALKGAIEAAALQGSNEASHALTGYNPQQTVSSAIANMGWAGLMGTATGSIFGLGNITSSRGIKAIEDSKMVKNADEWLAGFAAKTQGHDETILNDTSSLFKAGYKMAEAPAENLANKVADWGTHQAAGILGAAPGATVGHIVGSVFGPAGAITGTITGAGYGRKIAMKVLDPMVDKILQKPITTFAKKYIVPPMIKALTSDTVQGLPSAIMYGQNAAKGAKLLNKAMDSIFIPGMSSAFDAGVNQQDKERIRQGIDDNILEEQLNQQSQSQQNYAAGGIVDPLAAPGENENHFAKIMPTENMMMQTAKSRVYQHLKALKPSSALGMPFDKKTPTKDQNRGYEKALNLAANPLHIVKHLQDGSITSENIIHMNQMWPELAEEIKKEMMNRISAIQKEDKKPSYKVRQGLSMFLGMPLESVMTPQNIMAAQQVFMPKQPQGQQGQQKGTAKGTKNLGNKTNPLYRTQSEAAETDRIKRDL